MKQKKRGLVERGLSLLLTLTMLFSVGVVTVFAEGEVADDVSSASLEPGTYVVPLALCRAGTGYTGIYDNRCEHFNGRAKLVVGENGTQTITIGVENWDYYNAFVPMYQKYNSLFGGLGLREEIKKYNTFEEAYLEKLLKMLENDGYQVASNYLANPTEYSSVCGYTSSTDNFYNYGDIKYGNIEVDLETDHINDSAYVSFEIDDFTEEFAVAICLNTPELDGYISVLNFMLDTASMFNVNELISGLDNDSIGYDMVLGSSGLKTAQGNPINLLNRTNISSQIFDEINIEKHEGKNISVKYHISDSYPKATNFKKITKINNAEESSMSSWNYYHRSEFSDYEVSENNYITVDYNYDSIDSIIFGEYIYFENTKNAFTKRNYYFVQPVLSPVIKNITLTDEPTGVRVEFKSNQFIDAENIALSVDKNISDSNTSYWESTAFDSSASNWYKLHFYNKNYK